MSWLISMGTGLITAVLGAVTMGFLADRWTVWFRVSNFEGAAGFFVLFNILFGAIGGLIVGVICARYAIQGSDVNFLRGLLVATAWVAVLGGVLGVVSYGIADHPPRLNGQTLVLDIEIRTPPLHPLLEKSERDPMVSLEKAGGRTTSHAMAPLDRRREEDGRWVVPITLPLRSSAANRTLRVSWCDELTFALSLPLPARPTQSDFGWSDWLNPSAIDGREAWAATSVDRIFQARYRVDFQRPVPPPPSAAELAREREATEASALAALPADAPLPQRLPFTRYGVAESTQQLALQAIRAAAGFETDFASLAIGEDAETSAEVLRLVPRLPGPEKPLLEPVAAAGRDLLNRLNRVIEIPEAADPGYDAAAGISVRFSGWMAAVFHLRERAHGDFTAELRGILTAARRRPDSVALRQDVVRVASYYLHQWAGDAPLPTDPPPR